MRKKDRLEMEKRITEATRADDPRQNFVKSLWQKIEEQDPPTIGPFRRGFMPRRQVWLIPVNVLVLLIVVLFAFGPGKVCAAIKGIFNIDDPGLQTVEAAGMVTELGITAQPTILDPDSAIGDAAVTLDWVYIDEGRLVLGVVVESVPSGLVVDMPIITADRSLKPDLGFNSLLAAEDTGQIVFLTFNPVRADDYAQQVDFSVDLPLVEDGDARKTPLAMFHYDLEGIPIYKGQTHEIGQAVYQNGFEGIPIDKDQTRKIEKPNPDDLGFTIKSILVTPSFTEVEFCVNLSAEEVLALPRSDISLKIGDKPLMSDYFILEISESGGQTCLKLGFLDGGSLENDLFIFRFRQWNIGMMQYSPDNQIEGFQNMIIKP